MDQTDVGALAERVRRGAMFVAAGAQGQRGGLARSVAQLADELVGVAERCVDVMAEAVALLDIADAEALCDELCDRAALCAAALFLGRRCIESNTALIIESWPPAALMLADATTLAGLFDQLSVALLEMAIATDTGTAAQQIPAA